jgi:hypothetical protein
VGKERLLLVGKKRLVGKERLLLVSKKRLLLRYRMIGMPERSPSSSAALTYQKI